MCTKTKNSWGCGHSYKSIDDCGSRSCKDTDRYHILHEGDCRECKKGGNLITRGKEGKGRYAQELKLRDAPATRRPLTPINTNTNTKASPWQIPKPRERAWHSPTRRQADDAWLEEHERRQRDLEALSHENSSRGSHSPTSKDFAREPTRRDHEAARPREGVRKFEDAERVRVRPRIGRSDSHNTYDTFDSSRTPPRGRSYDSRFHPSGSPYTYEISPKHRLGHGLEDVFRDSTRISGRR